VQGYYGVALEPCCRASAETSLSQSSERTAIQPAGAAAARAPDFFLTLFDACQAFQGAWMVAAALAKFNSRIETALKQKKMQQRWQQEQQALRDKRFDEARPRTGEWEQRSVTPSTVGLGGGARGMVTSVSVENLSIDAMEKLSAFAVQQQLLRLEEERAEIEQQVNTMMMRMPCTWWMTMLLMINILFKISKIAIMTTLAIKRIFFD
jgi:hypothetical protein